MNMKYILRSVFLSAIGLALLGWVSFWFTTMNALGPDGESNLLQWYFDMKSKLCYKFTALGAFNPNNLIINTSF